MALYARGLEIRPLITESVAGDVTLAQQTQVARVDTSAARAIEIPTAACYDGNRIEISDVTGGCGVNNITLSTQGAEHFLVGDLAQDTLVMCEAGETRVLKSDGSNWIVS